MEDARKAEMEARAYRQMAVLRFSSMVMFSSILATLFKGRPVEEVGDFLELTQAHLRLIEKNAGNDPTMQSLVPYIESFIDDIVSTAALNSDRLT